LENSLTLKPVAEFHECKKGQSKEDAIKRLMYQKLQNTLMKDMEKAKSTEKNVFLSYKNSSVSIKMKKIRVIQFF